ncbi:acyltransferase [Oxalobacteraceae bacterium CAVE-383]|nr:acyltransferase [Oxalobacteraceae bacterium CAVE-383]
MSDTKAAGGSDRIDAITGLRGLAALLVVYGHSVDWFSLPLVNRFSGEIGVTVFFALSGFLMAYLYLGRDFTALGVTEYAIHRFSRIAPAYLFILLLSLIVCAAFDPNFVYAITGKNLLRHILFSGNVSVFWSITPEVEFYFLFVLLWAVGNRYLRRPDAAGLAGLALLAFGGLILMGYRDVFPGTFVGSKLHYFLFGAIAGVLRSKVGAANANAGGHARLLNFNALHGVLILAMAAGVVLILGGHGAAVLPFANDKAFYSSLLLALFAAFLVFVFSFPSALGNAVFANRPMVLCGECSFSIYLLHMPVIYFFHKYLAQPLPLALLAPFIASVLGLSWLNYRLVERPGARLIKAAGHLLKRKAAWAIPAYRPAPAQK